MSFRDWLLLALGMGLVGMANPHTDIEIMRGRLTGHSPAGMHKISGRFNSPLMAMSCLCWAIHRAACGMNIGSARGSALSMTWRMHVMQLRWPMTTPLRPLQSSRQC